MKKLISILVLFAIMLSLCACAGDPTQTSNATDNTVASTEATTQGIGAGGFSELTPEQMYGHINQLEPMDGYYKIWSEVGVQNMANHPDGKFELLCNVDMKGATLSPIGTADKPFTGKIKGANFTISNFTVQGGDETDFGFIGVNKGNVSNLLIENVTFIPGPNAKNIGSLAGDNQGELQRCTVSGTMSVEKAADGANCGSVVGLNSGILANTVATVDLAYNAQGAANVGGILGTVTGGTIEFIDSFGKLDIAGSNKTAGLFAGHISNAVMKNCVFSGASNTLDGQLFINLTGTPDDDELKTAENGLWRDNVKPELTEAQNKLRDRVVQAMYDMGSVEWKLRENIPHTCVCSLNVCNAVYNKEYTHYGIPYNHKGGSLDRMMYTIGEDGYLKDWMYEMVDEGTYDTFDMYMGNDCSTALINAWWTVSNSVDFLRCTYMLPQYMDKGGTIPVGDYNYDFELASNNFTDKFIQNNEEQTLYEAYAKLRKGDAYVYMVDAGGHTRMAAEDPVVVRNQKGEIDPMYSYVISHEQGAPVTDDINKTYTTWKLNFKYNFASLYLDWAIPVTCEELLTGEMEPSTCELVDGADGMAGIYTGTVKANYCIDSVAVKMQNAKGETVLEHRVFASVDKRNELGHNDGLLRNYIGEFDLVAFTMPLSKVALEKGETYSYTLTAYLSTEEAFVVKDASFVYGSAQ